GRLLREYHDAVRSFVIPANAFWKLPPLSGSDVVICHGDFAPWNIVWQGPVPVGIIDWEFARPRPRRDDLAWAAVWSVPLRPDAQAVTGWDCWNEPPNRPQRLDLLLEGYGDRNSTPEAIVDRAVAVLRQTYDDVTALAHNGYEPQATWMKTGVAQHDL